MYVLYISYIHTSQRYIFVIDVYIYAYTLLTRLLTSAKCLCDCLSLLQGDYTAVEMILCFPKSQSENEMDRWWFDFTLTFWRNEKVNHLAKIISWCKQCVHLAWIHCRDITMWIECKQGCSVLYVCCLHAAYILHASIITKWMTF